ncbi:protein NRT1/ PTR FAMILY 8.5-like [Cornus florida]|uniref:protein NRT1/ PTR FAMILY 8.5-like n=1 Tax=Cornus florida TaxID=4283 RepID=UPI0028A1B6F2|nr:protein NRT1/ PTR FAMILY 8.5-like [Cornus florida]
MTYFHLWLCPPKSTSLAGQLIVLDPPLVADLRLMVDADRPTAAPKYRDLQVDQLCEDLISIKSPVLDGIMNNKKNEDESITNLVNNGCTDYKGRVAEKHSTGGWKAAPFIIVSEMAEKMAGFAVGVNSTAFWTMVMHYSLPDAVSNASVFNGFFAFAFTIIGAYLADAFLGRFKIILYFSIIHALGSVMLVLIPMLDALHPPPCNPQNGEVCREATNFQAFFLYATTIISTIGGCGMKPSISIFGADQFDETDKKEVQLKYSYFNWFFFFINMGAVIAITLLVHVREYKGWVWGFGVPAAAVIFSVFLFAFGYRFYRYRRPLGSALGRFCQVIVASFRNHKNGVKMGPHVKLYEVSTKESDIKEQEAANTNNRWRLCTVTQVEEFKSFIRIFPIWLTTIVIFLPFSQLHGFFLGQAMIMNRKVTSHYTIPPGSVPIFGLLSVFVIIPIYDRLLVPLLRRLTGQPRGITSLQRVFVGLVFSILSMVVAAIVEKKRRDHHDPSTMNVSWLYPQFALVGAGESFTYVGLMEFFYDQATEGTKSVTNAIFLTEISLSNSLASLLVKMVQISTGGEEGWLRNDLNKSRLDYFYWLLAGIGIVNLFAYLFAATTYNGKNGAVLSVIDESSLEEMDDR